MNQFFQDHIWIILLFAVWAVPWKGYALWKAARREDKAWFILLLIVNTLAILEIFYIFVFSKRPTGRSQ
ncbi:MAG: DUF5652 family protein [Thermoleophilia bacterium]|jgi:hypothetical protein